MADAGGLSPWKATWWPGVSDAEVIGNHADPDGDGIPNLLEYALGLDPTVHSRAGIPMVSLAADRLQITFTRLKNAGDIFYRVDAGDDPGNWTEIWNSADIPYGGGAEASEQVTVSDPVTLEDPAILRRFLRLRVTL